MNDPLSLQAARWWLQLSAAPADTALAARLDDWLAQSAAHRLAYAEVASADYALALLPTAAVQQLPALTLVRRPTRWRRAAHALVAVAAALVLALGSLWLPDQVQNWRADQFTAVGQIRRIELADGSVLSLDSDSAVRVRIDGNRREVQLWRGALHVRVQPDPSRPFVVQAGGFSATALGTAYSVELEPRRVVVDHGRVQLRDGSGVQQLAAGDVALARGDGWQVRAGSQVAPDWTRRQRVFAQRPLREVLKAMDRYIPGRMWLPDLPMLDQPVTAVLDLADPVLAVTQLCAAHGLDVQAWPGVLVIGAR